MEKSLWQKIGYVAIGASLALGGDALNTDLTIEDATQVWTPDIDNRVKFYQKIDNGNVVLVGMETDNPEYLSRDIQELYNEKLLQSKEENDRIREIEQLQE